MLRTALLAAALLATSQSALAHRGDRYEGRVISVEPSFTMTFGSLVRDGFQVVYDFGGRRHVTTTSYAPGPYIVVPPVREVVYVVEEDRRHGRHHRHDRARWRDDWREESRDHGHRRGWRSDNRWEESHDRH
jgi:hypothetical protein